MQKYQGWTNYNTWLVALWVRNEKTLYEKLGEKSLEDLIKEIKPEVSPWFSELIDSALAEVNWKEISEELGL